MYVGLNVAAAVTPTASRVTTAATSETYRAGNEEARDDLKVVQRFLDKTGFLRSCLVTGRIWNAIMTMESPVANATLPEVMLSSLEARALGCLIEKELTTPDVYPLTL